MDEMISPLVDFWKCIVLGTTIIINIEALLLLSFQVTQKMTKCEIFAFLKLMQTSQAFSMPHVLAMIVPLYKRSYLLIEQQQQQKTLHLKSYTRVTLVIV